MVPYICIFIYMYLYRIQYILIKTQFVLTKYTAFICPWNGSDKHQNYYFLNYYCSILTHEAFQLPREQTAFSAVSLSCRFKSEIQS